MASNTADFIKIPTVATGGFQTMPVEPHKRLKNEEIQIELCAEKDADKIAEGLYTCFAEAFWSKMEPLSIREPSQAIRQARLAKRVQGMFHAPHMFFLKAVHIPTGQTVGIAGWAGPDHPIHNAWRKSAQDVLGLREKMGWSNEEIEEMWKGVSIEAWEGDLSEKDDTRREVLGEEPHWFLAPLLTFPEWQGRGVGSKLLKWATEQADANDPPVPLYLESAPTARAVYLHAGFVPQGPVNFVRRGAKVVKGLEGGGGKMEQADVKVVEKGTKTELAS